MDLTVLRTYGSEIEAMLVRAKLEANGIDALVQSDLGDAQIPMSYSSLGVRVLVRADDLAIANEALERMLGSGEDQ